MMTDKQHKACADIKNILKKFDVVEACQILNLIQYTIGWEKELLEKKLRELDHE